MHHRTLEASVQALSASLSDPNPTADAESRRCCSCIPRSLLSSIVLLMPRNRGGTIVDSLPFQINNRGIRSLQDRDVGEVKICVTSMIIFRSSNISHATSRIIRLRNMSDNKICDTILMEFSCNIWHLHTFFQF
jgi:hypothetical protein